MEYKNLSVDELQAQLQQVEQNKVDLEKALYQRWHEAKAELAHEIREMIDSRGYDTEEILELVAPKRKRAGGGAKKGNRSYTRYVDPENPSNVYVRGVLPKWMKEKMTAQGYDPSVKDDREAFKANYLQAMKD
ncbi:H-NS histone family protein [Thiohalocapsa halophila]|uniref:H-NS histone family protein n=1 Tax=Thiohalocapsa halophila TaxID=69359 RepID=A0ABS1CM42_9GAMM|nr:H-NS histone family protein [Thiohalocapsa halophila]MBK1632411.1 H-NS histone family protein [Thiohalocapsa halophila]